MKQVTTQHERFELPRMIKNAIKKSRKFHPNLKIRKLKLTSIDKETTAGLKIHTSRETTPKRDEIKKLLNDKSNLFFDSVKKIAPKNSNDQLKLDPNKINEFFANLADEMQKCHESPVDFDVEINGKTIFMLRTDETEKIRLLNICSKPNVEGHAFISNNVLKLAASVLAQPLTYLTNNKDMPI